MLFLNRREAGKRLAEKVRRAFPELDRAENAFVLALPRGGIPVAYEISKKLHLPLDLIVTHKLGVPGNPELAMGAIAEDGTVFLDEDFGYRLTDRHVREEIRHQLSEIKERIQKYRDGKPLPDLRGKTVLLVDDGIATGNTMQAAIRMAKRAGVKKVIVLTPVIPPDTLKELARECDGVILLETPSSFFAIGQFYAEFEQLTDEEVREYFFS